MCNIHFTVEKNQFKCLLINMLTDKYRFLFSKTKYVFRNIVYVFKLLCISTVMYITVTAYNKIKIR